MGLRAAREQRAAAPRGALDDQHPRDADEALQPEHPLGHQGARAAAAYQRRRTDLRRLQGGPRPPPAVARVEGKSEFEVRQVHPGWFIRDTGTLLIILLDQETKTFSSIKK